MGYAAYADYKALYGDKKLDEAGFARLIWEAERLMDAATTGVDGVAKLRVAMPTEERDAEAVKRCACALADTLRQIEAAAENIRKSQALIENADGTVQSRQERRERGGRRCERPDGPPAAFRHNHLSVPVRHPGRQRRQSALSGAVSRETGGVSMFNDTVTIFNRWRPAGASGDVWYPTVLRGVELQTDRAAIVAKYGAECADRAMLFIHYQTGEEGRKLVGGKKYLPPKAWQAERDPAGVVTFDPGDAFDFFIEGAWPDETPIQDSDYPRGFFDHMNRTRDGVYAVTQASVFKVIPHVEITGR